MEINNRAFWSTKYRSLILKRIEYRKNKEFKKADFIKNQLQKRGIEIHEDGTAIFCIWGPKGQYERECTWE